jgi:phage baseplate assembly protein W
MANININLNPKNDNIVEQTWTYRDIKMPLDDEFSDNKDVLAIRSSIANIFSWKRGQRILNPNFGNTLYNFLYEGGNDITRQNMKKSVTAMLSYEPRMNVINIDVEFDNDSTEVKVLIEYIIPKLNRTVIDTIYIK